MIGLDTNVLVRLYAADDAAQRRRALDLIEALPDGERAVVNIVVIVELMWTLRRAYRFDADSLAVVARHLTEHVRLFVPEKDLLREAVHRARETGGDIPDHLIALLNRRHGAAVTYTFDAGVAKAEDFALLRN